MPDMQRQRPSGRARSSVDNAVDRSLFAFGDSVIDAFNPTTWAFEGSIDVNPGAGNAPGGLWSMTFGGDGSGADAGWAGQGRPPVSETFAFREPEALL